MTEKEKIDLINKISYLGFKESGDPYFIAIGYLCSGTDSQFGELPDIIKAIIDDASELKIINRNNFINN